MKLHKVISLITLPSSHKKEGFSCKKKKMKTICLKCGHIQERKARARTRQRCSVCHSPRFATANGPTEPNNPSVERVKNITDNRKIGTTDDIYMPPLPTPQIKKGNKPVNDERSERWRRNELLHHQGRREQTGLITEVVQFIGSMVSEKNPRGHGSKAVNHAFRIAEIKRMINDEGGDTRLLGENTRKLTGDNDSILGLGFIKFGKGGILERFRRNQ